MVKINATNAVHKKTKTNKLLKTKVIAKPNAETKKIKKKLKERKGIIHTIKPSTFNTDEHLQIKPQIINTAKKIRKNKEQKDIKQVCDIGQPPQISSDNFIEMKHENIKNAIKGILKFHSENPKLQNQLFDEQFPIFLQISCYKVPKGFSKIYRIPLKHALYNAESEICLIVSEVKGIKNTEHDQHKEHYENLLATKGVQNIKNIMTFHEFRTEYETFEQKNRLVDLYDVFLADSKISGKAVKKCGKIFYKKRKVPTSIKLQVSKLKEHIAKTLSKTFLHLHLKGNSYTVQVGHSKMNIKELLENIDSIKEFLRNEFPGGFNNIMGIQIFAPRTSSIPLYMSTKSGKTIEIPIIATKKPKAFKTYRGELTTLQNAEVVVKPTGKVLVKKVADLEDEEMPIEKTIKKSKHKLKGNTTKKKLK